MRIMCGMCFERMRYKSKILTLFKDAVVYICPSCNHKIVVGIPKEVED